MRKITVLGSTGSIGRQTLDVLRQQKNFELTGLAAGKSAAELEAQIREFHPKVVCLYDEGAAKELSARVKDCSVTVLSGREGVLRLIREWPADIFLMAIMGMVALEPTLAAIETGADLAIASKEPIVAAGHLMMPLAQKCGARILPVDSEHSAVFQCLRGEEKASVRRLLITCSGGPFRGKTSAELTSVRPEDALAHPNWSMGAKITIDSSTLVNKGLEVMEAHQLYGIPYEKIEVVVHPQSVIHSMVEYADGSVKAQLAVPDMRLPIQYALNYPERQSACCGFMDFLKLGALTFEAPDVKSFPGLALAYEAGKTGGTMPTVFNSANEWAVERFLRRKLSYPDIPRAIRTAMDAHSLLTEPDLPALLETDRSVRAFLSESFR